MNPKLISVSADILEHWVGEVDEARQALEDIEDSLALLLARQRDSEESDITLDELLQNLGISRDEIQTDN